jgi:hypothetical protein
MLTRDVDMGSTRPQQDNVGLPVTRSRVLQCSIDLLTTHDGQLQCQAARQPGAASRMHATWRDDRTRRPPYRGRRRLLLLAIIALLHRVLPAPGPPVGP